MPDGGHAPNPENPPENELRGEEVLDKEGEITDATVSEGPLDPATGLPLTGVDAETGLPI